MGDFRIELDFARLDSIDRTTRDGIGTMLYFHATGRGDNTDPESFAQWRSSRPSEQDYVRHGRGIRITWSNFNTEIPGNSDEMRLRWFELSSQYPGQIGQDSLPRFPFIAGRKYHMTFERRGSTFAVAVADLATGELESCSWDDEAIGRFSSGYFGIRQQPGRVASYENLMLVRPH